MKNLVFIIIFIFLSAYANAFDEGTKRYSLITDFGDSSSTVRSIRMLLDNVDVFTVDQTDKKKLLQNKDGLVILLNQQSAVQRIKKAINAYARSGGIIVMDIRSFATLNGCDTKAVDSEEIIIAGETSVTRGYRKGEPVRYSDKGKLVGIVNAGDHNKFTVTGESRNGDRMLVEQIKGKGKIIAVDMISLKEPEYGAGSENKYLFMINALGNGVRYGEYYPEKYHYADFVSIMKEVVKKYPSVSLNEEGEATGGYKIYSLSMGNPANPCILVYSCAHGNEWENCYGVLTFIKHLAEDPDQDIINLNKYYLKVIPILNPFGYENMTRQNGNKVDLNRNGDFNWHEYTGVDTINYKPGAYDWKGSSPFSEPESQTLRKVVESADTYALVDIHGNPSGTGYNKWMGVAAGARPEALEKAGILKEEFNNNIRGRYVLRQKYEKVPKHIVIETIQKKGSDPNLYNTLAEDRYGYIVEFLCGYSSTPFIVMQTDIVCEFCAAFCRIFGW